MFTSRYFFYLIDTDGRAKLLDDVFLPGVTAAINRVEQIGDGIDRPGCRIRVRDGNGIVIFVGVTTGQGYSEKLDHAA